MKHDPKPLAASAIFRPAEQHDAGRELPQVAAARERDRLAREAVSKGESLADAEIKARFGEKALEVARKLPSKAVLEKRWPKLRLNRMTHRWTDEASGARGDDLESLMAYLERPKKRRG